MMFRRILLHWSDDAVAEMIVARTPGRHSDAIQMIQNVKMESCSGEDREVGATRGLTTRCQESERHRHSFDKIASP